MTLEDVPVVAQIDHMSFSLPWPEHAFRYEVADNPASRCFVVEAEDKRVAAMIVSWIIIDELHIATIATHPDFRRQGIGSQILTFALKDARQAGARRAFLEVREKNEAAQAMYRKFGFEITGRRPKYYKDNGEDAILMTLESLEAK
ncbi:MAG: ribosomal protein S18-alanine N-acetyltransferase [Chloroflexi bacterium]|nr:ribosomal protein S18-alanine N-acetyltransferase [Chloroflexota bacterium]